MVRFEKFKMEHTQENKPILQNGLDAIFDPHTFVSVSGGRTGTVWNTAKMIKYMPINYFFSQTNNYTTKGCDHNVFSTLIFKDGGRGLRPF